MDDPDYKISHVILPLEMYNEWKKEARILDITMNELAAQAFSYFFQELKFIREKNDHNK